MTASPEEELILTFHHEVVEHLGLKLYQNRPTNVIAELVSNSWDADASNVWIDIITAADPAHESLIAVADNGCGMTFSDVRDNYLVIGMPKRDRPDMRSPGGRKPMGRKGIGKLAPFGIAAKIDVVTIAVSEVGGALITWFRLDLAGIRDQEAKHSTSYHPELILANAQPAQASDLGNPLVAEFIERIQSSGGASRLFLRELSCC
jgi:hypothetical protein